MIQKSEELQTCFEFRQIRFEEVEQAVEIEQICFPPNEACSPKMMRERVATVPELFFVAVEKKSGKVAGFLNGMATDEKKFRDEFFKDATLHCKNGAYIMLLGLDVLPQYRGQGLATEIVRQYIEREKKNHRKALYLTCLDNKIPMYEKMGFTNLGISNSTWGDEVWYDMCYTLEKA